MRENFISHDCHQNTTHLVGIFSPMYGSCLNTSMILARKASMPSPFCHWKKNTLSPVTVCIGEHYVTKGCYDFLFPKWLCNNQLKAAMRLHIAAIFRFHGI